MREQEARAELDRLWKKGTDFLQTEMAILGGAMSWVSERNLVSALANAGAFGVLACGSMSSAQLDAEIIATRKMTSRPFGVNLITMHPDLEELVDVCAARKVSHVVLAGGLPRESIIARARDAGMRVMAFAPALALAKRLIRSGVQALIIEGAEAGGHVGSVSLNVLAQEILPHVAEVPVFVAGGIARGETMLSFLEQGASGVQLGTLFAASVESIAHENFKKAFRRASARDAVVTVQLDEAFPVIPVRALANGATRNFMHHQKEVLEKFRSGKLTREAAQLEIEHFWAGALRRAVMEGDVESGSLMAGQSVGMVKESLPVAELLSKLVKQALWALEKRSGQS